MVDPAQAEAPVGRFAAIRAFISEKRTHSLVAGIAAQNFLRLAGNLVLTRLLAPEAFGALGIVMSINVVLTLLSDMGYHTFIVRTRNADDLKTLDVVWTLKAARAVILASVMFALAGPLAAGLTKPELSDPIRAASLLFLFEGARSLYPQIAERQRRIAYITAVEFLTAVVQTVATIAAAVYIRSVWALIFGMYVGACASVVFSYALYRGRLHRVAYDSGVAREVWSYARYIVPSSIIVLFTGQADKFLIGRLLPLETFGVYILAFNLVSTAKPLVLNWAVRVLFPLFAEVARARPHELRALYVDSRRKFALFIAFALGGVAGGGSLVARILFDDRYLGAGPYISILTVSAILMVATQPAEQLSVALGKIKEVLTGNALRFAWVVVAGVLGYWRFGVMGLVAAFGLVEVAPAIFWWIWLRRNGLFDPIAEFAPLLAACGGAAIGYGLDRLVTHLILAGVIPSF